MISRKLKSLNGHVGYKILRSYSPEEFFIALAIGLLLKSNTGCTHLRYGHKLTRSYLIPCAFSCATEPASVSHDRRKTVNIRTWPTISHAQRAFGDPGTLPLGRPLLRVRVRMVRITQIPWDGATHLSTDEEGVRRGRRSNSVKLSTACQPAVNRSTIATKRLSRPCKCHHLIMVIVSMVTIDPERLTVALWLIYQFIATMNSKSGSGNVNKHHLFLNNFIAVYTRKRDKSITVPYQDLHEVMSLTMLSPSPVQAMDRDCKFGRHPLWHCKFPQVLVTSANLDMRLDMGV